MARGKRGGVGAETPELIEGTGAVPLAIAPGGDYGKRQATEEIAASSPMYDEQAAGQVPPQPQEVQQGPMPDAFAPTNRPSEPLSAGQQPQGEFYDPVEFLRIVYQAYPSPWIASLIGDEY